MATCSKDADRDSNIKLSEKCRKIPESIWTRQVRMVQKYNPINLGQGFPDFPVPDVLASAICESQKGANTLNQYTRGQGHLRLVNAISNIYSPMYGRTIDPLKEIVCTIGGYESLYIIINSVVDEGDEVVLIEPFFDCYDPMVRNAGGVPRFVTLKMKPGGTCSSDFSFDRDEMRNAFNEKTKAVIVNTPHNPTGKVFNLEEMTFIADLCKQHNALYISDEVYEWLVYDGSEHVRAATLDGMWERTVTVCSAGKTFNVTGWKLGWTIGPAYFINACAGIHSLIVYTCPTPLQEALAVMFEHEARIRDGDSSEQSYWSWLHTVMTGKRERMFQIADAAGLHPIMPQAGYFMLADISKLDIPLQKGSDLCYDEQVSEWMIKEHGIACIPVSVFYGKDSRKDNDKFIRFCFIKSDETLDAASLKLKNLQIT